MSDKLIERKLEELHRDLQHLTNMVEKIYKFLSLAPNNEPEEHLMTVKEVAAFLRMEEALIYEKCKRGDLPCIKKGKQLRFKKVELIAWMQNQESEREGSVDDFVNRYLQNRQLKGY
jgi:excisionase family DNA binding protein